MDKERGVTEQAETGAAAESQEQAKEFAVEAGAPSAEIGDNGTVEPKCNMNCDYCDIMPCLIVNLEED